MTADEALKAMKQSLKEGMEQMPSVTSEEAYAQARRVLNGEAKTNNSMLKGHCSFDARIHQCSQNGLIVTTALVASVQMDIKLTYFLQPKAIKEQKASHDTD